MRLKIHFVKWKGTFRSDRLRYPNRSKWTTFKAQSWIFWSDQTEMVRSIWCTNRNFRNFEFNGKRPQFYFYGKSWASAVRCILHYPAHSNDWRNRKTQNPLEVSKTRSAIQRTCIIDPKLFRQFPQLHTEIHPRKTFDCLKKSSYCDDQT